MAGGWNSGSDRDAMLRRVAIVLSSLPAPMATKLLGSMGPDSKQAVRRTMSTLSDVDPLERQRAIQAFKVMFQRQPASTQPASSPVGTPDRDALQLQNSIPNANGPSSSRLVPTANVPATESIPTPRSPLAFLSEVDDQTLARLLKAEHPQTIAFVLASISPGQAARVLPQLGAKRQHETMSRIGRLGEIPDTAVAEVAEHFRSRLKEHTSSDRHSLGRQALDAILAAMPNQASVRTNDEGEENSSSAKSTQAEIRPSLYPASDVPALDLTHRLRVAEQTWPDTFGNTEKAPASQTGSQESAAVARQVSPQPDNRRAQVASDDAQAASLSAAISSPRFGSTDGIHQHLIQLSPAELCQALAKVDTRDAMLALCGLPVQVADAALAELPRAQARMVRIKMNSLGSLHLREIDHAKEKVAEASLATSSSPAVQTPLAA